MERFLQILQKRDKHEKEGIDFTIKQFDGAQKAIDWISEYKTECEIYEIQGDEKKIKNLKKYLEKTALEWYQTNLLKDEEHSWQKWKAAFIETFSNKGWSAVRYAYNFRYISGSFVEYAIKRNG
jgi:arsenate reductase-like glutaredoxin family protein